MKPTPRTPGPLAIPAITLRALANLRRGHRSTLPFELDLGSVNDAERALGGPIPDELLGLCAATGRTLGTLVELTRTVGTFYEASEVRDWKRTTGFHHVAFDADYNDEGPLCSPLDGSGRIEWWFLRKGSGSPPTFLVEGEAPFVSYIRWKYASVSIDLDAPVEPLELPALVIPVPPPKIERRVRHPVFGDGKVLEEIPPDKVVVDFGANGVKKLLSRTLQPID